VHLLNWLVVKGRIRLNWWGRDAGDYTGGRCIVLLAVVAICLPAALRAQTIPGAPSNLTASAVSSFQISLSWSDTSTNEDGFKVDRSLDGTNFTQIAQLQPDVTNYRNSKLFPDTTYFYRVRAYNSAGDSTPSDVSGASTPTTPCPLSVVGWGYGYDGQTTPPADLTGAVSIAAGYTHSFALKSDGTVIGWGDSYYSTPPGGVNGVVAIAAGLFHSLALKGDGTIIGWGDSAPPAGLSNVVAVAAGYNFSLALKSDGTVFGWGANDYGQAMPPAGLSNVVAIAAGFEFSLALKSDGTVVAWGRNNYGQTAPGALTDVVAISAGGFHGLALKSDGSVVGWGNNGDGQATIPAEVTGVVAIAAGGYHSLAVKSDGTVVGWGYDYYGQATPPAGLAGAVDLGAGFFHSLALAVRPGSPAELTARSVTTNQVDLSWSRNSSDVDGFEVEQAPVVGGIPGTWTPLAIVGAGVATYSDMPADTTGWYRVRAHNSCAESPWSTTKVPALILNDTWSTGIRTNQDLPTSSAWWASDGQSVLVTPGSMTVTVGVSSVMAITYFTPDTNSLPVELNVGDTLTATFNFILNGVVSNGISSQGFRLGILNFADSTLNPKRMTEDGFNNNSQGNGVQGYALFGKVYGTFGDDQPIDIRKRTNLSDGALIGTSADWTSLDKEHLYTGFSRALLT
jgi:Regulator of chromosome condensation (RCC1) repeat/Fibronectin type III domain